MRALRWVGDIDLANILLVLRSIEHLWLLLDTKIMMSLILWHAHNELILKLYARVSPASLAWKLGRQPDTIASIDMLAMCRCAGVETAWLLLPFLILAQSLDQSYIHENHGQTQCTHVGTHLHCACAGWMRPRGHSAWTLSSEWIELALDSSMIFR